MPTPFIAVVDDNQSVMRALGRMVRSLGMEAGTYSSAAEFLADLQGCSAPVVACLILDIQMPGMTGLELLHYLQKDFASLPVILISAHDDPVAQQEALSGRGFAFLRKPLNDELLISTLYEALEAAS